MKPHSVYERLIWAVAMDSNQFFILEINCYSHYKNLGCK